MQDPGFKAPLRWRDLDPAAFAGLFLPGGHAPGMRQYLGSAELQQLLARFWASYEVSPRVWALAELYGAAGVQESGSGTKPMEAILGGRFGLGGGLSAQAGAGFGLTKGYGTADVRVVAALSYGMQTGGGALAGGGGDLGP